MPDPQQDRVDEQQLRRLGIGTIVRVLGEPDHVAAAGRLMHQVGARRQQRQGFLPYVSAGEQLVLRGIDTDVDLALLGAVLRIP